jgi:hypothetical protein
MKQFKKLSMLGIVILIGILAFTGCSSKGPVQLSTPEAAVIVNNGRLMLMTTDNPNAESYVFGWYTGPQPTNLAAYAEVESASHFLDVTSFVTESAVYHFYIQAVGNETRYLTSGRSSTVSYDNSQAHPSPLLELSGTTLSWTGVTGATGYRLYKNNILMKSFTESEARVYNIAPQITSPIVYQFEVQAMGGTSGGITYENSLKSNIIEYVEHLKLSVPQNVRVLTDEETQALYLTWDTVTNANGYTIKIDYNDENTQVVTTNQFVLTQTLQQAKRYTFEVKANASGALIESPYSSEIYYDNYLPLETPTILGASRNGADVVVVWEEVEYAESYTLVVNGAVLTDEQLNPIVIYEPQVLIGGELEKQEGGFDLQVYANAYDFYLQSALSELFFYSGIDLLEEPTNLSVTYNTQLETVLASWEEVAGATYYIVAVGNETFSVPQLQADITELVTIGQVVPVRVQARGNGYTTPSEFSAATMFNYIDATGEEYEPFTQQYFYYYDYYDYYITSQEEFNLYMAYLISHQIEDNDPENRNIAYIDYELTTEQQLEADLEANGGNNSGSMDKAEEINYKQKLALLSYTETHQLTYGQPMDVGSNFKTYKINLNFDTALNPTLTSSQNSYSQSAEFVPYQSATGRSETYNNFVSELSLIEVEVENSDQLFMVVNSGAKPVFTQENSQAEAVYEAAKSVLRQIIDNSMTDYQKMLAIFDYVSYNTVYDHEVYNLALQNPPPSNLQEYQVFYLEGVLLDGKAVCDGIAKTVALLASMEGIEAVKVNGQANGGAGLVGHAWNKVYLEIDGVSNWYVIDATWNDISSDDEEFLSHRYFLMNDADIENTHFAASGVFNPVAITEFDYYNYTEYTAGYNYYIENQAELAHIVDYLLENNIEGVELKLAENFTNPNINQAIFDAGEWGSVTQQNYYYSTISLLLIDFIYS